MLIATTCAELRPLALSAPLRPARRFNFWTFPSFLDADAARPGHFPQLRFLSAIPALSPAGGNTRQYWKTALAGPDLALRQPAARILRLFRLPAVLRALACV